MIDNATRHRAAAVADLLDSDDIQQMESADWSGRPSDINTTTSECDIQGRRLAVLHQSPKKKKRLRFSVQDEWGVILEKMQFPQCTQGSPYTLIKTKFSGQPSVTWMLYVFDQVCQKFPSFEPFVSNLKRSLFTFLGVEFRK